MLWEEVLVAAFEDIHLGIVEAGVVVGSSVSFPDETAPGISMGTGSELTCALHPPLCGAWGSTEVSHAGMSATRTLLDLATGYRRGWGNGRKEGNQEGSISGRQFTIYVKDIWPGLGKGKQKERWARFKRSQ